jgi:hypothetical protein
MHKCSFSCECSDHLLKLKIVFVGRLFMYSMPDAFKTSFEASSFKKIFSNL